MTIEELQKENELLKAKLELYKGTLRENHILIKKLNKIEEELDYMSTDSLVEENYDIKDEYWDKLKRIINREV